MRNGGRFTRYRRRHGLARGFDAPSRHHGTDGHVLLVVGRAPGWALGAADRQRDPPEGGTPAGRPRQVAPVADRAARGGHRHRRGVRASPRAAGPLSRPLNAARSRWAAGAASARRAMYGVSPIADGTSGG